MERLTMKGASGLWCSEGSVGRDDECRVYTEALDRLAAYEDAMPLERVQELAKAEKAGRLVVLPLEAKEGDPIPQCFYGDGGLCPGLSAPNDDEPIEMCKRCWYCSCGYRQEAEEALREEAENG